jgi:hypothetical protein
LPHRARQISETTIDAVGTLWTLERDGRMAVCVVLSARRAAEVRVLIDGDTLLSQRCERHAVFGVAEGWKRRLMDRGWIRADLAVRSVRL